MDKKKLLRVASVAIFNEDGLLLFGKRGDCGKYCLPGGKFEVGEHPSVAAERELFEETGLVPLNGLEFLGDLSPKEGIHVYSFKCVVNSEPSSENDPDAEFETFVWVDSKSIPKSVSENLYNKKDVTLQLLGLQEKTISKSSNLLWKASNVSIPKSNDPSRIMWDEIYEAKVKELFVKPGQKIERHLIDISKVRGYNMPVIQERVSLYKRMLSAGDKLPPVVVSFSPGGYEASDGSFSLLDGNHRQEACEQYGTNSTEAIIIFDDGLQKNFSMAALVGGLLVGGSPSVKAQPNESVKTQSAKEVRLPRELMAISKLESNSGKNLNHVPNKAGQFHSAFGELGMKISTAHDEYKKSPALQKKYPKLHDPADFVDVFTSNPSFYNEIAIHHFNNLKSRHGSPEEAARAWRFGSNAVMDSNHPKHQQAMEDSGGYVSKYKKLLGE